MNYFQLLLITVLLVLSGLLMAVEPIPTVYGTVTTKSSALNIRQGMGQDTLAIAKVSKGVRLRILETHGTWYKVQLNDGTVGYVSSKYIKVEPEKILYGIVITKSSPLNIREEMSKEGKIIAKVPKDEKLRILKSFDEWYMVQLNDNSTGYASKEYIQVNNDEVHQSETSENGLEDSAEKELEKSQKWYEGGTLHHAKGKDWRTATQANRLATSADFIAKLRNQLVVTPRSEGDFKFYATELSNCLTEFLKIEQTDNQPIDTSVLMCVVTMNLLKK